MSAPSNTPIPSDRALLWRWLAAAFTYPDVEIWEWLQSTVAAVYDRRPETSALIERRYSLAEAQSTFLSIFGHTVRGDCPPHELEYGELKADALFQPHRLADIAAFYSALGLEVAADERVDHIAMECEFYAVLCAKEEIAGDQREFCREIQKKFLRDHLARWTPAFSRRVERLADNGFYRHAARQLRAAVETECARHGVRPGNADLPLRPVEQMLDPCDGCGIGARE
jgi:TorA maturation chaperone TorD